MAKYRLINGYKWGLLEEGKVYDEAYITSGGSSIKYHATEGKYKDDWELVTEEIDKSPKEAIQSGSFETKPNEQLRMMCIDRAINAINHGIGNRNLIELAKQIEEYVTSECIPEGEKELIKEDSKPKPRFITEDGVEMYDGDEYYLVLKDHREENWIVLKGKYLVYADYEYNNIDGKKRFSTEKLAKAWVEEQNKPKGVIEVLIPENWMNCAVTVDNFFIADTNNSPKWDNLKFPLPKPKRKWNIKNYTGDMNNPNKKTVVLIDC